MSILEISNLSLSFGGVKALQDVSFRVPENTVTTIIGPNGAGKTSLFNCISGFYKPQQGTIRYQGQPLPGSIKPPKRAALGLARTFQNIALFRGMTVLDNIKLGAHVHMKSGLLSALAYFGPARREEMAVRRDVEERIIDFLEIDHIRRQPVASLSYGLQKRVELARALAMQPKVLMLDEPVAGMSVAERKKTAELLRVITKDHTVLVIEHDMQFVGDIADRVTVMHQGKVLSEGSIEHVKSDPKVFEVYLGH